MKKIITLIIALVGIVANAQSDGYNRVSVGYHSFSFHSKGSSVGSEPGFNLQYTRGIGLTSKAPLFIEVGGKLTFTPTNGLQLFRTIVPVSATYKYTIPNTEVFIQPFVGCDLIGNVSAENTEGIKRVQGGWHVGGNIGFKKVSLGVSYNRDFTDIWDDVTTGMIALDFGIAF